MARRKKKRRPPTPRTADKPRARVSTLVPQTAALVLFLVAGVCYTAYRYSAPHRQIQATRTARVSLASGPYIAATMFMWFSMAGAGWQAAITAGSLRKRRDTTPLDWALLAAGSAAALTAPVGAVLDAPLPVVLVPIAAYSLFACALTARLCGRSLLVGVCLGLVPIVGPLIETYRRERVEPAPSRRPTRR